MAKRFLFRLPSVLLLLVSVCNVLVTADHTDHELQFMKVFEENREWMGVYDYKGVEIPCYMYIHSSHPSLEHGLMVTFKDKDATISMEGSMPGSDPLEVSFTTHTVFEDGDRFYYNFTMEGRLSQKSDTWGYLAVVTFPLNSSITEIRLHPAGAKDPAAKKDSDSWRYVLVIGLPILLAVVGIVGTFGIVYWAKKKGYIRHVPKTYDNFNGAAVTYDNSKQNVHM